VSRIILRYSRVSRALPRVVRTYRALSACDIARICLVTHY
jgi:hypothetical protein